MALQIIKPPTFYPLKSNNGSDKIAFFSTRFQNTSIFALVIENLEQIFFRASSTQNFLSGAFGARTQIKCLQFSAPSWRSTQNFLCGAFGAPMQNFLWGAFGARTQNFLWGRCRHMYAKFSLDRLRPTRAKFSLGRLRHTRATFFWVSLWRTNAKFSLERFRRSTQNFL